MGLSGNFKETSFADLLQFYSVSRQTVAVSVRLSSSERVDGTFYFADGDLVGAKLADAEGREAVRRALRLREGAFTVEIGARPAAPASREALRNVVREEIGALHQERGTATAQSAARHAGATAAGGAFQGAAAAGGAFQGAAAARAPGPGAAAPRRATTTAAPAAGAQPGGRPAPGARPAAPGAPPPGARGGSTTSTTIPRPQHVDARRPPAPAPFQSQAGHARSPAKFIAVAAVALAVVGAGAWLVVSDTISGTAPAKSKVVARGVFDDSVVLGMVGSFTGSNKERGKAMKIGWDTAIAEINEGGGIHGRKLRLVTYDDGYDPARTGPAMKEAVEVQGAFAIVGNVGTATSAIAAPYAGEHDAVFFGAVSGADILRKTPPDRHVFNYRVSVATEAAAATRWLVDVRRVDPKRIATLEQDDEFGASGRRGAIKQLAAYGVPEASVLKLAYPRNTADVREAVAKLKERAGDFDAVVMTATYKPAATFVRRAKDAGLKLIYTIISSDAGSLSEELVLSGQGYTDDVLATQPVPIPTSPATTLIRYRKALEKYAPGEKPGSTSLEAWIGAQIFLEALRRAGRDLDTAKLVAALESIQNLDLGIGAPITYGPTDHQGCDVTWGWLLQPDGSYKQVALE